MALYYLKNLQMLKRNILISGDNALYRILLTTYIFFTRLHYIYDMFMGL